MEEDHKTYERKKKREKNKKKKMELNNTILCSNTHKTKQTNKKLNCQTQPNHTRCDEASTGPSDAVALEAVVASLPDIDTCGTLPFANRTPHSVQIFCVSVRFGALQLAQ
jgi:hypothetical protein